MDRWTISCESCERNWPLAGSFTFYEQQSLESHPCPHCGAYTLACNEPLRGTVKARKVRFVNRALVFQPARNLVAG